MTLKPLPDEPELGNFLDLDMDGISNEDVKVLNYLADKCTSVVGDVRTLNYLADKCTKKNSLIIEIGSWKGHSSWVLGRLAKERGGKVICVDHWRGSPTVQHHIDEVKTKDILAIFRNNMRLMGMEDCVLPMAMDSLTAASLLKDDIADMIFIDADHRYSSIIQDIKAWYPKLKTGGIFSGHDCNRFYEECSFSERAIISDYPDADFIYSMKLHPGVTRAVHEVFGTTCRRFENSCIWFKEKEDIC